MDQVYGQVPPITEHVVEYGAPTAVGPEGAVQLTNGLNLTVPLKDCLAVSGFDALSATWTV